ncbi:hypothetical protein ACVC7V_11285 [Hydrogenophaga sp. A37]|uniref:hypothetical protein n=1 Tax=Hydrogenophaga sp. A37 TaxID=1945864 RepID=UPI00098707C3|nr:hypothetical protein [Hydrogenophaga sp. A37]OOG85137.1 hypothetical protein B0E41_08530 [Hydrogenophaga sp. A37]
MIYVRRDPSLIPEKVLRVAERAQAQLEILAPDKRSEFIEKKSHVWRGFARYLAKMSYGKCWYSESDCVQSFKDVDHYRPKKQAKRSDTESDDGYPWLSFSWDNFRLAAQRSNQINRDDDTEESVGKGAWFPLMQGSMRATWDDRCLDVERPLLLDPARLADVRLIEVTAEGRMGPTKLCLGAADRTRVEETVKRLSLDLPGLVSARKQAMRLVQELVELLEQKRSAAEISEAASAFITTNMPAAGQIDMLQRLTGPQRPYASAARAQLRLMGYGELCVPVEQAGAVA